MYNRALAFILCFGILGHGYAGVVCPAVVGCPQTCTAQVQSFVETCKLAEKAAFVTANQVNQAAASGLSNATQAGSQVGGGQVTNAATTFKSGECAAKENPVLTCISNNSLDLTAVAKSNCIKSVKSLANSCADQERMALGAQANLGSTKGAFDQVKDAGSASSGGMGWLLPGLIGAGLGALLGSMLGGDDESSSSSADEEEPPSLPETPVAEESSSSSTSTTSSVAVSQSSESISQPAIVTVPTVEPGDEAGDGDDEIFIAASGAIPDPDSTSSDSSASGESSDSATTGGSTAIGGTTGTDGSRDTDVVDNSTGTGNSSSINVVDDNDETVVGLVSGNGGVSNRGLATYQYDSGASDSSAAATGGGSGMLTGLPTSRRTSGRNLASGSSSSASSKSSSSASSKSSSSSSSKGSTSSKSSSSASSLTSAQAQQQRNSVVDDLVARGLISASSSSSVRRR